MRSHGIINRLLKILVLSVLTFGCAVVKNNSTESIVTIDNLPVSREEFLYVFEKNNLNQNLESVTQQDVQDYLELFINFKLKVREAEALGLHQDSSFMRELEGYRKQLAQPYLTESKFMDSLVQVTYQRLGEEIKASHILITVSPDASPADTLTAFGRIADLKSKLDDGADFNNLALQFSQDPSAKQNGGSLGYFSAMQMVFDFENAAYNLREGEVSAPVRTRFGYHLIKLEGRRPSKGKIQVAHIMIRANDGISATDSLVAANKASEIYQLVQKGDDWDVLCRQFSEDYSTRTKGGSLPWFKSGDLSNIPTFEKAAFELEQVGDICKPVKTPFGWHIIRLENRMGLEPFEEIEPRIRASLTRNSRGDLNKKMLVKRLKSENNFNERPQALDIALSHATDSLGRGLWKADSSWNDQGNTLFSINDQLYTLGDFYQYLQENQPFAEGSSASQKMTRAYTTFADEQIIKYEEAHLSEKYPEYRLLYQEYRDGLLLFQLMEQKVWNKAVQDTSGLNAFFANNRQRYQWQSRAQVTIYNAADENALNQVKAFLDKGQTEYLKYDFTGTEPQLNKAQLRILDKIARDLKQGSKRLVVLEYQDRPQNQSLREQIVAHLNQHKIDKQVKEITQPDLQSLLVYMASTSAQDLAAKLNEKQPLTLQLENGRFQKGESEWVDQVSWEPGATVIASDDRLVLVHVEEIIPAGDQQLSEVKGQVISDYQEELEKQWISELRNKYTIEINQKVLRDIYEQYEN